METKDIIIELRKQCKLSQDEMAEKLFVTRQAVSRWETGETVPSTETIKLISKEFGVSTDILLGAEPALCQSCGMSLYSDGVKGTEADGETSEEYCMHCYKNGSFLKNATMEEVIEDNVKYLDSWNEETGLNLTPDEARKQLSEFLPTLKRWKNQHQ